ncbi:lipid A biosynthesis protein [Candidatus Falkowbacteria bacterium]|jgi:lipid-A-disaccharide synthase-like uncharacterized protein|nr:lipid A biosynthesis protein [Candidatus Falkowbacteria bacterium]MBT4433123.1 lipid A biosynthesis protein [Candidatus Falkowbacteria bacterium]
MKLDYWLILGLIAQGMFFMRFLIQWLASEIKKESVIPVYFWYFSIVGGIGLLAYSIHIKDPVFILGNSIGIFIYSRNLMLVFKKSKK